MEYNVRVEKTVSRREMRIRIEGGGSYISSGKESSIGYLFELYLPPDCRFSSPNLKYFAKCISI